jgi:hypothetical protein
MLRRSVAAEHIRISAVLQPIVLVNEGISAATANKSSLIIRQLKIRWIGVIATSQQRSGLPVSSVETFVERAQKGGP